MNIIKDKRNLKLSIVTVEAGELKETAFAEICQFDNNIETLIVCNPPNMKKQLFIEDDKEIFLQASEMFMSPLEWIRIRLSRSLNFKVEVSS